MTNDQSRNRNRTAWFSSHWCLPDGCWFLDRDHHVEVGYHSSMLYMSLGNKLPIFIMFL
jgi:hypothetical protein